MLDVSEKIVTFDFGKLPSRQQHNDKPIKNR